MLCTRRLALGALFGAVLTGCGGGGGDSAGNTGGSGTPAAGGGAGAAPASGSGGPAAAPVPSPSAPTPSPQAFSEFGPSVVASNASSEVAPAVARLADGGNVVLWVQDQEIRGRLTDAAGAPVGDVFTAVAATVENGNRLGLGSVSVAPAGDGGFVIAWRRETTRPTTQFHAVTAVQARRFTRSASPVWEAQASAGLYSSVSRPVIEPQGDGFVLAWIGEQILPAPRWAYLQRITGDGTRLGSDVRADSASGPQEHVGLAPLADGTLVAVWHQHVSTNPNTHTLHMRRFAPDLAPLTAPTQLPGFPSRIVFPVDAEALADGNVAIAWGATGENTRPFVRTAVFTPDGQAVSAVQENVLELPPSELRVLSFGESGYGVVWQVENAGSRQVSASLFLQRMGLAGDLLGTPPQEFDRRLTFWVSPTTGATVRAGSGIDVKGGDDRHFVAAFHRADENPNTYLMGR